MRDDAANQRSSPPSSSGGDHTVWVPSGTPLDPTDPTRAVMEFRASLLYLFDPMQGPGYVFHYHILDHEDNEMMRPYLPVP